MTQKLEIIVGAKAMLRSNIDFSKGLFNDSIGHITEIYSPVSDVPFHTFLTYETDISSVRVDFANEGIHIIHPKFVQFPAKFSYGTAERSMLPMVPSCASTVYKMQGSTVDCAVIYLRPKLFAAG
ncbi:hypothetical protein PR048_019297 [Dryococelus australis]|uniref:Uncharacterized protein n=1 Tax=Dryococelus australis TaxID=614101 RepID=A0ABQ9H390_9NEOP|nr:hypothetical protein PR048_019297 [Dryococelus australis]